MARLSILNPQPQKLPGPTLLHHLVPGGNASAGRDAGPSIDHLAGQPAIDYRAPDGRQQTLTYCQLHQAADALAAKIRQHLPQDGTTAGQTPVVPVLLAQAPELYVALLAVLKAGAAFCPIQLDAPADRIRFVLGDVNAAAVLTTADLAPRLPAPPADGASGHRRHAHPILVDNVHLDLFARFGCAGTPDYHDAPALPTADDVAYVMYTSGSTGTPKGVAVPHGAATQSLLAHDRHIPAFSRFLQFAAPTFDVSVFEIFFPLFRGATLVCCSRADLLNDLPAVLRTQRVDACELTPTVAASLLRTRAEAPGLRLLLTIGEMLTEPVVREFGGSGPDRPSILWAMYGPTEAAIHCTLQPALAGDASARSIGFPLDTVSAYILRIPDEESKEGDEGHSSADDPDVVPVGEIGELAVGGLQLACGYRNRPEQTAAAFIDTKSFGRLYRTGDKACVTEQGLLECYGRLSEGQVKLRGQRIELGEIEEAVLHTDGCLGSVAAVIDGQLVAFCDVGSTAASPENANDTEQNVLASCRAWLPRFMIPGDIVLLSSFPRLASGKVDRKQLAADYAAARAEQAAAPSPGEEEGSFDDLDSLLHTIVRNLVGSSVEHTASLAAAGVDSLRAIQFSASIRSAGYHNVGAVDVLTAKTLQELSKRIRETHGQDREEKEDALDVPGVLAGLPPALQEQLRDADIELVCECTPVQASMLAETVADSRAYCNWIELAFAPEHDGDQIAACFQRLIANNAAWRTGFVTQTDGRLVQVVWRSARPGQVQQVHAAQWDFRLDTDEAFLQPFSVDVVGGKDGVTAVLQVHHAVYDGWSMDRVQRDLEAMLAGEPVGPGVPYSSVVAYHRTVPTGARDAAKQFWAQALYGYQPSPLPDMMARRQTDGRVLVRTSTMAGVDRSAVERLSRNLACGTQVFFQAALAWLWSAVVGSPDIVLGTVTSGRTLPLNGIESVVGPCLQPMPIRVDVAQVRLVHDLLDTIQSANRALLPHAFLPLADIKKLAGLRPGQALYDVLFVYQESLYSGGKRQLVREVDHKDYLETKLLWEVEPGEHDFRIRTTFHGDVFPDAQITLLVQQFGYIVRHMVANAERELDSLRSSLPAELLSSYNLDFRPFDDDADLGQLVQRAARRTPDRPALCFATTLGDAEDEDGAACETLTYAELNRLANQVARCVQNSGAASGDAVAICMDKSPLLYAGILGILKAGCAYVPLLPSTPSARVELILEQADVRLCVADTVTADKLAESLPIGQAARLLDLQSTDLGGFSDADLGPARATEGSQPAYIVYTSGSTGVPKGVCVTQRNLASNLALLSRIYPLRPDGRLLQSCSQAFDVSVFEIFFTWINGMCLCAATNDVLFADLERAIRLLDITHLSMTPTVAALVDPSRTPSVDFLVAAGEPMTANVAQAWGEKLFQGYGPSELTNICIVKQMHPWHAIFHLGHSLENTSALVLHVDSDHAVPRGAVGELCFGGEQVAAGYVSLPALTAEKFVDHPLYGRIYRTGDLGRMLPDGSLTITGRMDDQIKLRGQRIELNEINALLLQSGLVSKTVTLLLRHDDARAEQLASFFVPTNASSSSTTALAFHPLDPREDSWPATLEQLFGILESQLPAYMVPTYLVPVSDVPLTPAGKTNRALLGEKFAGLSIDALAATSRRRGEDGDGKASAPGEEDDSQWTATEKQLRRLLSQALDTDETFIGRWTPLASLGLDSLSAIPVARVLFQAFHRRLAISDIIRYASVAQLAQLLDNSKERGQRTEEEQEAAATAASPTSLRYDLAVFSSSFLQGLQSSLDVREAPGLVAEKVLPCMPLQEAMLVSPIRGRSYVNRLLFRLPAQHHAPDALRAAWLQMCARHAILRTCFMTTDNARHPIAQVVLKDWTPPWLEFTASPGEAVDAVMERHVQTLASPLDSLQPPLSFAVIHHPSGFFLSFVCHHAVYDGEAMRRLQFEVERLVREPSLQASPASLDFGVFLEHALALPNDTDAFWKKHLSGYRPMLLSRPSEQSMDNNTTVEKTLTTPLSAIQGRAQALGFSLLATCQGVWASVLRLLSHRDEICFGNVYNGRSLPLEGVGELVAPCFNTLPVRVDFAAQRSAKDVMAYFHALNPDMMRYQFTSLRHVQKVLLGDGTSLFDSLLLLQQQSQPLDASVWTLEQDDGEMDVPLVCEFIPDASKDTMHVKVHASGQCLSGDAVQCIAALVDVLTDHLLRFSLSHVPQQDDLPLQLQDQLARISLRWDTWMGHALEIPAKNTDETWTGTETAIRAVLSQLAGVPEDRIRRDTTIYRLGLDSVSAVQVASMLRRDGLPVSAIDVMEHPTCLGLAQVLSAAQTEGTSSAVSDDGATVSSAPLSTMTSSLPLSEASALFDFAAFRARLRPILDRQCFFLENEIEAVLPCTPLQTGLLTEFVRTEGRHYLNVVCLNHLPSNEVPALAAGDWEWAWMQAAAAIPMLRTGFIGLDDEEGSDSGSNGSDLPLFAMVQLSAKALLEGPIRIHVAKDGPEAQSTWNLDAWKADFCKNALRNLQLPPWQVILRENTDTPGSLSCTLAIHHALYDASSLEQILDRVQQFVELRRKNRDCVVNGPAGLASGATPPTELVVSDILSQVVAATAHASTLENEWKAKGAAGLVVNTFPVLTPLKVARAETRMASRPSAESFSVLAAAASKAGFTLHAVFQAAWTRILSSYVGAASVVFGSVLSGRNTDATRHAVFPCLSTLPVVVQNEANNRTLVEALMATNVLLHKSQHVPLNQIQKWLVPSDVATAVFDTLLVYQNAETVLAAQQRSVAPPPLWTREDEVAEVDYAVSLEVVFQSSERSLAYQLTFNNSVLAEEQAQLLLDQFDAMMHHLVMHPAGNEDDLVASHPRLYSMLPAQTPELPSEEGVFLLHQFVECQARKIPDKTALEFVTAFEGSSGHPISRTWSYKTLNRRGNQVASMVCRYAPAGSIVAVCFDKCPEAYFAILGILKAGCSFVALDPGAPPARKAYILRDSAATLLLTDAGRAQVARSEAFSPFGEDLSVSMVEIEDSVLERDDQKENDGIELSRSQRMARPSDTCYCLYTSGTTGTPKGCAITHENAVQAMLAFQVLFRGHWDGDARWLQFASFHFDVSILEQYWTWSVGLVLVGAPRDLVLEDLAGTISRLNITHIDLTPSLGRLLDPRDVPSLCRGVFITGGEPLKQEMLDPWGPTGAVHNFYGPTEATIGVTSYPQVPQNGRASNIGRQFPNVGTLVFRPGTQTPILRGGVGELCVSGKLVGKGYLNRDDLTRERFPPLQLPLSTTSSVFVPGEHLYRTGDLVRLLHDGCFDFLGRADDQVKLRGQRLEIGEINHAIRLGVESSVDDVATLVVRDEDSKKDFLVSFVVSQKKQPKQQQQHEAASLYVLLDSAAAALSRRVQTACRERLPGYMVPTYVVQVPFMPLSANNKADAKELRRVFGQLTAEERMRTSGADDRAASKHGRSSVLKESTVGQNVVAVLRRLGFLGQDDTLTPDTSLAELGVDSISVLRLARALKRNGLTVATPSLVLAHPILGDLVAALEKPDSGGGGAAGMGAVLEARLLVAACKHRHRSHVCEALGVEAGDIESIAPCSALQQGMLSRSRADAASRQTYFNVFGFRLLAGVSVDRLRLAWEHVVAQNAVLRTRFVSTQDGFVQVTLRPNTTAARLPWWPLSVGGSAESEEDNVWAALAERQTAWVDANQDDVVGRPLELHSAAWQDTNLLVLHLFHGLYDATSLDLVLQQVRAAYDGEDSPSSSARKPPAFLEALVHGPLRDHASSRPFWENHLRQANKRHRSLPVLAHSQPAGKDVSAQRTISFALLHRLRVTLGVTHAALVQAAWVSVLQKIYGGEDGVTLGMVVSGRAIDDLDGVEEVVGPLFNTLPFHVPATRDATWAWLAQTCHAFNTSTMPFQHVPLRDINRWTATSASQPLFDVLFSFQLQRGEARPVGSGIWVETAAETKADYPLALEVVLHDNDSLPSAAASLELLLVAKGDRADSSGLEHILDSFEAAVEAMSAYPHDPVYPSSAGERQAGQAVQPDRTDNSATDRPSSPQSKPRPPFSWEGPAETIRREIALLAGVPMDAVREDTALLELGLDSVDTIKLSARLRSAGIPLRNSQLVRGQTIAAMLAAMDLEAAQSLHQDEESNERQQLQVDTISAKLRNSLVAQGRDLSHVQCVLPPTPLQEAMVADMIQSDFARYFNHDVLQLDPRADIPRLKSAWRSVVRTNPILRTVFFRIDSQALPDMVYCQAVLHANKDKNSDDGLMAEHAIADKGSIDSIIQAAIARAQEGQGESGLLQLAFVHSAADDGWYLVLSLAHALYDGWSLTLLHQAVEAAYEAGGGVDEGNGGNDLPPPYGQQLQHILQASGPRADQFWRNFLADAQPTHVKRQRDPRGVVARGEAVSAVLVADLVRFCKAQATSMQVVGQACWAAVLATLTGSLDVLFGVVLSGRDDAETQDLLFPTMNTVPVRVVLQGTTAALLQYMQSNMGSIREHQHYPLRRAQRAVVARKGGQGGFETGIFNTLFILQKQQDTSTQDARPKAPLMESMRGVADVDYPVCVEMEVVADRLLWRTACDTAYVGSENGAARILRQLDQALAFLLQTCNSVLQFEDDDVSVCGLQRFSPNSLAGVPEQAREANEDDVNDSDDPKAWSDEETQLRAVLATVSGVPESAIHRTGQTLYHLGLDSISAIRVSALLKQTSGFSVSVRDLLAAASIKDMAAAGVARAQTEDTAVASRSPSAHSLATLLSSTVQAAQVVQTAGLRPDEIEPVLPATAMQVHMISAWQNAGGRVFFPVFCYRLTGARGGRAAIYAAWRRLVAEYPMLRTVLLATQSTTVPLLQAVVKAGCLEGAGETVSLDESGSEPWPSLAGRPSLPSLAFLQAATCTDGAQPPSSYALRFRIHHALYDAVSLPAMVKRLAQLCGENSSAAVSPPEDQVSSWARYIEEQVSETTRQQNQRFWTDYFREATRYRSRLPLEGSAVHRISCYQPSALADVSELRVAATRHGLGLQSLFFAAYARTVVEVRRNAASTEDADEDAVFGIYLANREDNEVVRAAYPTLCLVPLFVRAPCRRSLVAVAAQIQKDLRQISLRPVQTQAQAPLAVGLWEIQAWTGVRVDSFVNFLLPDGEAASSTAPGEKPVLAEDTAETEAAGAMGDAAALAPDAAYPALRGNPVRDAYEDAVDVEAAVRGTHLDIGVFGPASRLDQSGAAALVARIAATLKDGLVG